MNSIQPNPVQAHLIQAKPRASKGYLVHQATALYVVVDNFLNAHPCLRQWRTSNHDA